MIGGNRRDLEAGVLGSGGRLLTDRHDHRWRDVTEGLCPCPRRRTTGEQNCVGCQCFPPLFGGRGDRFGTVRADGDDAPSLLEQAADQRRRSARGLYDDRPTGPDREDLEQSKGTLSRGNEVTPRHGGGGR